MITKTSLGTIKGNDKDSYAEYLGVRYATAGRFEYATLVDSLEGKDISREYVEGSDNKKVEEGEAEKTSDAVYDATRFRDNCPQSRGIYEHLDIPERAFYKREFRNNVHFSYSEDCLNLNIYAPKKAKKCPVILYYYGGGFNSGCSNEDSFDGGAYAKRDVILVTANYRVGILGYFTHEEIYKKYGREGNFGLDDQFTALLWVRKYISEFGGDPDNITLMGQSAGAISIQYLCLSEKCKGLFKNVVMMSGAGLFPKSTLPRLSLTTRSYWLDYMSIAEVKTFEELKSLSLDELFKHIETIKESRKDNTYNTMPVVDGYYLTKPVDELMSSPLPVNYMVGFTNNDMYAILMSHISKKYASQVNGYAYYFDIDAPGEDKNGAFHSSDLRYVFGTLFSSHRPYSENDYMVSDHMTDYIANFSKTGSPNGPGLAEWSKMPGKVMHISKNGFKMGHTNNIKLLWNTLTKGDPK